MTPQIGSHEVNDKVWFDPKVKRTFSRKLYNRMPFSEDFYGFSTVGLGVLTLAGVITWLVTLGDVSIFLSMFVGALTAAAFVMFFVFMYLLHVACGAYSISRINTDLLGDEYKDLMEARKQFSQAIRMNPEGDRASGQWEAANNNIDALISSMQEIDAVSFNRSTQKGTPYWKAVEHIQGKSRDLVHAINNYSDSIAYTRAENIIHDVNVLPIDEFCELASISTAVHRSLGTGDGQESEKDLLEQARSLSDGNYDYELRRVGEA